MSVTYNCLIVGQSGTMWN